VKKQSVHLNPSLWGAGVYGQIIGMYLPEYMSCGDEGFGDGKPSVVLHPLVYV